MKVKVCFTNEIHRLSKVPDMYRDLVQLISKNFHAELPKNWALEYISANEDKQVISNEESFKEFRNQEAQNSGAVIKLYIVPIEELKQSQQIVEAKEKKVENKEDEDYQIIQKEEIKIEDNLGIKGEELPKNIKTEEVEENKEDVVIEKFLEDVKQMAMTEKLDHGNMTNKVLIDLNELEKIVQRIFNTKIAQITESIKAQMGASVENSLQIQQPKEKEKEDNFQDLKEKLKEEQEKEVAEEYFQSLMEKAKKLHKCFPKEDFDMLCVYVNEAPEELTLEELVENYKH